ncbi:cupin domain-containing protein [Roseitranquillus sediminis]|uniref:cupin domain-containing protein n=1 Tax=Roseitranquillus sediminis TaxID=2809051 RepID=UPI001D0C1799|nr:cupin domain-containing protein [Roseitranquillus sediminis]MBM9595707.1 cupin domain-containing protein [Roseitranquillus sediminis]
MTPESFKLEPNDAIPNNPRLPVLHYRRVLAPFETSAEALETLFRRNGWPPQWRNGIFDYHHYHSTAHEALGVAAGSARVMLGGPGGREAELAAGDVVVLPAGTGHCLVEARDGFLVVGAYPEGQEWDLRRDGADRETLAAIAAVPRPAFDPVGDMEGAIFQLWPS